MYKPLRLIIEAPPRHGKSELLSHWLPVWLLMMRPDWRIILCAYEAHFAARWGRLVRNEIEQHSAKLGFTIVRDSRAVDRWHTNYGGGMLTAGVGGPITGWGASPLLTDDPVKNAEQASSQIYRDKIWDWFLSTAYTRLEPNASAILTMARWNEDDLAGRLIKRGEKGDGEKWEVITMPALAVGGDVLQRLPGEALWPERYDAGELTRIKGAITTRVFEALFQQHPTPLEGGLFDREWFDIVPPPSCVFDKVVRYWDLAASEKVVGSDPDYTCGTKMGHHPSLGYFILDVVRARRSPAVIEATVARTAMSDGHDVPIRMEEEPGSAGKSVISHYSRNVVPGFDFKGDRPTGDKVTRAIPFAGVCERKMVHLVEGLWNEEWLREVSAFPHGGKMDQVDSSTGAFKILSGIRKALDLAGLARAMGPS